MQCHPNGNKKTPVDYVNPYIGTINPKTRGLTPIIKVPGGTVGLFPSFTPEMQDQYLADKIFGFPLGFGNLMINTGTVKIGARENASKFDHDLETATPYYYQALLEDPDINAEFTITDNTVLFRFTLPENKTSNLLLTMIGNTSVEIKDKNIIEGSSVSNNRNKRYFSAVLSKPFSTCGTWQNGSVSPESKLKAGDGIGLFVSYPATGKETVEIKIGISSISIDEARGFIASEVGSRSFDQVKMKSKELWNNELSLLKVKGGTEKQLTIFYTALYRTRSVRMGNVWDTYRCAYPLQSLIKPEETLKAIRGFVKTYEETGWLPSSGAMIGNHSTAVIVDAYMNGLRDFDIEKAYEGMKKNAMEATMIPWKDAGHITELEQCYFDKGFFPALSAREDAKVSDPSKWGNEPSFHIPYLYNYAGQPWLTQSRVRQIMDLWYDSTPFGLCGDDDGGAMTSWYVLTAMGIYPQCPGRPIYDIGSPIFEETIINVGEGKSFVIEAKNVSAQNKYIQSAELNGTVFNKTWISHADIIKGGKLVFQMGPRPNKNWGSSADATAPSMSAPEVN